MRRLLVLSRYTRLGASSRLRTDQYIGSLEEAGFEVTLHPFFDDSYLQGLYAGGGGFRGKLKIFFYFARRLFALISTRRVDVVWLEKEALPWFPWLLERLFLPGVPIVSDFDDAVFHRYDQHRSRWVRKFLGRKIDSVMAASTLVTAGNEYLAVRARAAGAPYVQVVPTVVDVARYQCRGPATSASGLSVGWMGTPQTWADLGQPIHAVLLPVLEQTNSRLLAVGASMIAAQEECLEVEPWSEESEIAQLRSFDVGIMPLPDTPWTRGKCGYKLIQYMACGVPVIASPVGVNSSLVEHGVNGFLASTDEEWRDALAALISDPGLRQRMGEAGRQRVEEEFSLQVWEPRVAALLRRAMAG